MYDLNMEDKMFLLNAINKTNKTFNNSNNNKEDEIIKKISGIFASLQNVKAQVQQIEAIRNYSL
jgi:hypothetical protein